MHINKDFTQGAVFKLTGPQVQLVPTNDGLLRVAFATVWQALPLQRALNNALDDAFRDHFGLLHRISLRQRFCRFACIIFVRIHVHQ